MKSGAMTPRKARPVGSLESEVVAAEDDGRCCVRGTRGRQATAPSLKGDHYTDYAPLFEHGAAMRAIRETIEAVADTDVNVLVCGESGVGKEVVARALHAASRRREGPFVKLNCAALPVELLEAELFGYERGAFTGAYRRNPGRFEAARGGTILLDEIAELPAPFQAKLLHVLQDFVISRIGGRELIPLDVRIIGATNRDLQQAIARREFREDLYYRLSVVGIHVPPLRARREEIPGLAAVFLARYNALYRRTAVLSPDTIDQLCRHTWPGNVRELDNAIRRLVVLGASPPPHVVPLTLTPLPLAVPLPTGDGWAPSLGLKEIARRAARDGERRVLAQVLEQVRWNRVEAARILKVSYKTLLAKIAETGLAAPARVAADRADSA